MPKTNRKKWQGPRLIICAKSDSEPNEVVWIPPDFLLIRRESGAFRGIGVRRKPQTLGHKRMA